MELKTLRLWCSRLSIASLLSAICCTVHAGGVFSSSGPVGIIVENVDEDARACGVSDDMLDAAARLVLSGAHVPIHEGTAHSNYLYLRTTVIRLGSQCIGAYTVQYQRVVWLTPGAAAPAFVFASVWDKGGVYTGSQVQFASYLSTQFELLTKQFAAAWLKDNSSR